MKIRRPLLARGTKAADVGYGLRFNSHRSCFQLSAICCEAVYKPEIVCDFHPAYHEFWIQMHRENPFMFKPVSKAAKIRKTGPKATNK